MPIEGEVIEVNENIESNPESVNDDPYGNGWLIKIKVANASKFEELLSAEKYEAEIG